MIDWNNRKRLAARLSCLAREFLCCLCACAPENRRRCSLKSNWNRRFYSIRRMTMRGRRGDDGGPMRGRRGDDEKEGTDCFVRPCMQCSDISTLRAIGQTARRFCHLRYSLDGASRSCLSIDFFSGIKRTFDWSRKALRQVNKYNRKLQICPTLLFCDDDDINDWPWLSEWRPESAIDFI